MSVMEPAIRARAAANVLAATRRGDKSEVSI